MQEATAAGAFPAARPVDPICLQGNHSDIDYRNIVRRPVVK
jgi:hypothetical protein